VLEDVVDWRFEKTPTLTRSAGIAIRLALRWQLFDSPNRAAQRGPAWLRATARRVSIGAAPALTLGPEAQLLHMAGHLARHDRAVELRWLDDIAALLAAPGEPILSAPVSTRVRVGCGRTTVGLAARRGRGLARAAAA
jgi:hypothetical protein